MEVCVNDEVDDENKRNLMEENETKLNDKDFTEVQDKQDNVTNNSEKWTSAKDDTKLNKFCEGEEILQFKNQ